MSFSRKILTYLIVSLALHACGHDSRKSREQPRNWNNENVEAHPNRHNILVIDDGFDLNHNVFHNKITGRYRLRCSGNNIPFIESTANFERQKQMLLQHFASDEENCILVSNLTFEPSRALEGIQAKRDEWNTALLNNSITETYKGREWEADTIYRTINSGGKYHGTNTAGLIAYENQKVNIFILQLELTGSQQFNTHTTSASDCPKQSDIDLTAKLYSDIDVIEAYANAPLAVISAQDNAIEKLVKRHKITMINKSYGLIPFAALQKRMELAGCDVDFRPVFVTQARLIEARRQAQTQESITPLIFQAAGNENLSINGLEESLDCSMPNDNTLLIGGITHEYQKAPWSNYGACVELYAVGDRVITPAPLNFLNLSSGTSYSAPMALRFASLITNTQTPPSDIKAILLQEINSQKILADHHYPEELVYKPQGDLSSSAFTSQHTKHEIQLPEAAHNNYELPLPLQGLLLRPSK